MRTRSLAAVASAALVLPLSVAMPSPADAADSFSTPLSSLGQGHSANLRDTLGKRVAAGRSEDAFPHRPVSHRTVPGSLATDPRTIQTTTSPATAVPSTGSGFAGGNNTDGVLPPDTNADIGYDAAGNAWLVQWVNLHYQMYERPKGSTTWTQQLTAEGNTVFTNLGNLCSTTNDGDPVVVYDRLADRWVLTQFAFDTDLFGNPVGPYGQCVAVSQTGDPTGAYNLYSWNVGSFGGSDYFPDYPKLGVWPNGYYLTFNYYSGNNLSVFNGAGVVVLDRTSMLAGNPAQANATGPLGSSISSMLPVSVDDTTPPAAGLPETLVALDVSSTAGGSALQWWHVSGVTWNPVGANLTRLADLPVATYAWNLCNQSRNCIPQPGTKVGLDGISDRLLYRAGYRTVGGVPHVVLDHTVNVATSGNQAAVRWYDVTNVATTPTLAQQGTYSPDTNNRWMGSGAMDSAGDLALGYSMSGPSAPNYPSIRYAGRAPSDPAGTLGAEQVLKAGGGSQTHSSDRWGDYSSLVVDPVDGCTFWYTNEYYTTTASYSWSTWIGSFSFPGCGTTATSPPAAPTGLTAAATAGTSDQIDLSWSGSSGATSYDVYRGSTHLASTTSTSYHDSGLTPSTQYSYTVTATNAAGTSGPSNTATATTNAAVVSPPGAFTLSGSALSKSSISLSWTASSGASSYTAYRRKGSSGSYTAVNGCTTITTRTCTDSGLTAGTSYSYYVVASNAAPTSTSSNTITVRTPKH